MFASCFDSFGQAVVLALQSSRLLSALNLQPQSLQKEQKHLVSVTAVKTTAA